MYLERTLSWFMSRVFFEIFIIAIFNYTFGKLHLISQVLSAVKSLPAILYQNFFAMLSSLLYIIPDLI